MRIFITIIIILTATAIVKAQIDSTLKKYYPLKDGNYWEYTDNYNLANSRVMGDTILPNAQCYKILKNIGNYGTTYYEFLRIDDSMNVWKYAENFSCNEELLLFILTLPDRSLWKECYITPLDSAVNFPCLFETKLRYNIVLQQAAITKSFCGAVIDTVNKDTSFCGSFYFTKYDLAKNFGPVFMAGGGTVLWLSGAIIDGIQYGQILLDVGDENLTPGFRLDQNYPNPFNPSTIIKYSVASALFVTLKVYDVLGNEIASLVNEEKIPGIYTAEFNGAGLSSGIYFYRLSAGDRSNIKKMLMVK
jgi:hypothetical protein